MDERHGSDGQLRPSSVMLDQLLNDLGIDGLIERQRAAEAEIQTMGIFRWSATSPLRGGVTTPMWSPCAAS